MGMNYRNKLLFVLILAVAIIASVMIAISWINDVERTKMIRDVFGQIPLFLVGYVYAEPKGVIEKIK